MFIYCQNIYSDLTEWNGTWWRGLPTIEGKTARGASSPANPALTKPEPLSHTRAVVSSSSHMVRIHRGGL